MIEPKGKPHPSGRPVRSTGGKKGQPVWRCPLEQPATPRLRPDNKPVADAVGFRDTQPMLGFFRGTWDV